MYEELAVDEAMNSTWRTSLQSGGSKFLCLQTREMAMSSIFRFTQVRTRRLVKMRWGSHQMLSWNFWKGWSKPIQKFIRITTTVLLRSLWSCTKGINVCGTVWCYRNSLRKPKYYPADLLVQKVDRGYYDYRSLGPLLACVWMDKWVIHFLTTLQAATQDVTVKRRTKDGTQEEVNCPPCLPDYQAYMHGVDRGDRLMSYYNVGRRSTKWWKRIFAYLIEVACLNAYVLRTHGQTGQRKKPSYLNFWLELLHGFIGGYHGRSCHGHPCLTPYMSQDWTSLFSTCLHMVAHCSVLCVIKYVRSEVWLEKSTGMKLTWCVLFVGYTYALPKIATAFENFIHYLFPGLHSKQSKKVFPFPYNIAFLPAARGPLVLRLLCVFRVCIFVRPHLSRAQ